MSTKTRFEKEAKGNSEMVYCIAVTVHLNLIRAFDQESTSCKLHVLSRESLLYENNNVLPSNLFMISLQVQ